MNVVYFAVGEQCAAQAEIAARALRATNPQARAWCITDAKTEFETLEPFRVQSSPATLIFDRTIGQAMFLRRHGAALFLDSDCVVNGPLDGVFEGPVAVTERIPPANLPDQIYNGGVLYGDESDDAVRFWLNLIDAFTQLPRDAWAWFGDQVVLPVLVDGYREVVRVYQCATHNYTPDYLWELNDVLEGRHVVHFKGRGLKRFFEPYVTLVESHYGAKNLQRFDQRDLSVHGHESHRL